MKTLINELSQEVMRLVYGKQLLPHRYNIWSTRWLNLYQTIGVVERQDGINLT